VWFGVGSIAVVWLNFHEDCITQTPKQQAQGTLGEF